MGSVGPWVGSLGLVHGFSCFIFYFINHGGYLNHLGKSLIYRDLSSEVVAKTTSVNHFSRHG
jgi:hypothetical protein